VVLESPLPACCKSEARLIPVESKKMCMQGDQIGLIFASWTSVYVLYDVLISTKYEIGYILGAFKHSHTSPDLKK
jgi:hypothetical protein